MLIFSKILLPLKFSLLTFSLHAICSVTLKINKQEPLCQPAVFTLVVSRLYKYMSIYDV